MCITFLLWLVSQILCKPLGQWSVCLNLCMIRPPTHFLQSILKIFAEILLEWSSKFINFPMKVHIEGKHTSAPTLENSPEARPCHTLLHSAQPGTNRALPGFVLYHSKSEMRFAQWAPRCVCCNINNQEFVQRTEPRIWLHHNSWAGIGCSNWLLKGSQPAGTAGKACLPKPGASANISLLEKMHMVLVCLSKYIRKNKRGKR